MAFIFMGGGEQIAELIPKYDLQILVEHKQR